MSLYKKFQDTDSWESGNFPYLWKEIDDPELGGDWNEDEWYDRMEKRIE